MGNKRKQRNSSDNSGDNSGSVTKQCKQRGPSEEISDAIDSTVSEVLSKANAVLYDDLTVSDSVNSCVFGNSVDSCSKSNMADKGRDPTNKDLMDLMKSINDRLVSMEAKLGTLKILEEKVTNFEKELARVWVALDDRCKKTTERVERVEDRVDTVDMGAALLSSRVAELEKERSELRDDLTYMQSQSMRNNLVFTNIPEADGTENETADVSEKKLRQHLQSALKIAKETAESIRFERVHRTPGHRLKGKTRNIVAKFSFFQDRELVRRQWKELRGTDFHMFEQFPKEVSDKRRKLVKDMKEARSSGKRAWIVYDTLYIDGKPVKN
jgi:hypothetical protein